MAMQLPSGADDDGAAPISDINVTPLVDVMLVLLIIFMVTAPMLLAGVPVQLPRSDAARLTSPTPPLVVTVTREGETFLQQDPVPEADLAARIKALREGQETPAAVHLRGDRELPYGEVLRVLGGLRGAGVDRVSLVTEAAPAAPPPR